MKSRKQRTVLLALSGGVDSAVSALLLKKQGYNVIGLFMQTFREENKAKNKCKSNSAMTDKKMAEIIAKKLKIKFISRDYKKEYYKEVILPMIKDYKKGLTPNPDIECNKLIKFPYLLREAENLGADYIATGHYAKILKTKSGFHLLQGKDKTKDQSYFLYELNQKILSRLIFPIGNLTKKQIRRIAKRNDFPNWNKPGTTGICFLGKTNGIKPFLETKIKQKIGKIFSPENNFLGTHEGSVYYTIGQRIENHLGLKIEKPKEHAQDRYYIVEKRKDNLIIAGPKGHPSLLKREIIIHNLHQINPKEKIPDSRLKARIRHLGQFHTGKLRKEGDKYAFIFQKQIEAIAAGQSIVLYNKNKVIGGGEMRNKP